MVLTVGVLGYYTVVRSIMAISESFVHIDI